MANLSGIEREVLAIIQSYMPRRVVHKDKQLIKELRMDSDDATGMINELERKYKFNASGAEWKQVATPQDVINLVARYVK